MRLQVTAQGLQRDWTWGFAAVPVFRDALYAIYIYIYMYIYIYKYREKERDTYQ